MLCIPIMNGVLGRGTGVRPSPGAASSDLRSAPESSEAPLLADVTAPGDGRTPTQSPSLVLPISCALVHARRFRWLPCLAGILLLFSSASGRVQAEPATTNTVTVLDFTVENPTPDREQIKVAADFLEMALQREGVATLERRQIRLLLGERNLWQSGAISSASIRAAELPLPEFFVQGKVRGCESNRFSVTVTLVRAQTATLEASFFGEGNFPKDLADTLDKIARQAAPRLNQVRPPPASQPKFEGITWMPEMAFKFFCAIERYAGGDYGGALAMFHELRTDDRNSKLAWLWEARCYNQCGLPEQAGLILKKLRLSDEPAARSSLAQNRPVVAVLALRGIAAQIKWKLAQRLAESGKVLVFDPEWIGATAREVDLQLTGEMVSPPNAASIWLAVDSVILLDTITGLDGKSPSLRLRQQDLMSGKIVYKACLQSDVSSEVAVSERLADQFLSGEAFSQTRSPLTLANAGSEEPIPQDSAATALAKVLRLVEQNPGSPRLLIGLADCYSPWTRGLNYLDNRRQYPMDYYQKMLCLDQVVSAIGRQREQPDASFLLASALWRKRVTRTTQPWKGMVEGDRWQLPHEQEFRPLCEWFPHSADYAVVQQLTNYDQPPPRYLQSVFSPPTNTVPRTGLDNSDSDARINADLLADLRRFAQQTNHIRAYELYWCLFRRGVPIAKVNEAFPQMNAVYWEQQRFSREFYEQARKFDERGQLTAASRHMMTSCNGELRMFALRSLIEAAEKELSPSASAAVMREQVGSYLEDFGALAPMDGNLGIGLNQVLMCWRKANDQSANKHYENAEGFYEVIHRSPYVGQAKRLTAAYDLATDYYAQKRFFEASELLKEILAETEHHSIPPDRAYMGLGGDLHDWALALLKKVRLYGDAELDMNQCCGPSPRIQEPSSEEAAMIESLYQQWINAGTPGNEGGAEKARARAALASHGQAVLPLLIRELELGKVARWQLFWVFSALGSNAAPVIEYILPFVGGFQAGSDHTASLGAMNILIKIGRPAACSIPILIVTAEQDDPYLRLSAEEAIRVLGPAPPRTVPYLARLLYHQNPAVCLRSAKAIVVTAGLSGIGYADNTGEELVLAVRKWWGETGNKVDWTTR